MSTKREVVDEDHYFVGTEIVTLSCFICLLTYHASAINLHRKQSTNLQVTGGKILVLGYYIDVRHISVLLLVCDILSTIFCIADYSSSHDTRLRCDSLGGLENCLALSGKYFGYLFIILRARFDDNYFTMTKVRISYAVVFFFYVYFLLWGIVGAGIRNAYLVSFVNGACSYSSESNFGIIYIAQYVLVDFIFSIYFYIQFIKPLKPLVEKVKDKDQDRIARLMAKVTKWTTVMLIVTPVSWILMFVVLSSSNEQIVVLTPIFPGIDAVLHAFCIIKQFQRENLNVFRYMFSLICPCIISDEESFIMEEKNAAQKEEETKMEQTVTSTGTSTGTVPAENISLSSGLFRGVVAGGQKKEIKHNDVSYNKIQSPTGDSGNAPFPETSKHQASFNETSKQQASSNDNNKQQTTVDVSIKVEIVSQNASQNA